MTGNATGEAESGPLRLQFDRSVKLAFHGSAISSDGGLLLHRELDDALGLTDMLAELIADPRTGKNGRHRLVALLRQSVFSRLAGYEDVNDADSLRLDPVMRQVVAGRAVKHGAASASAMGRFETEMLTQPENFTALADLPGRWIDAVHDRQSPKSITLDMDSSESPVHGDQEGAVRAARPPKSPPKTVIPPPARSIPPPGMPHGGTERERHTAEIAAHRRMNWQKDNDYGFRSLGETGIGRLKNLTGGILRARTFGAQRKETKLHISVLIRQIRAAKPVTVRVK